MYFWLYRREPVATFGLVLTLGKPYPATDLQAVSVSYREVVISFTPGESGGRPQTITCEYRNIDSNVYVAGPSQHFAVDYQGSSEMTIASSLLPTTEYLVTLVSDNDVVEGEPSYSERLRVHTRGWFFFITVASAYCKHSQLFFWYFAWN